MDTGEEVDLKQRLQLERLALKRQELDIRLKELQLPLDLAKLGLGGTLKGALAGMVMLLAFAAIGARWEKLTITGTHLTVMVGLICATVGSYGAFVFNSSISIEGKTKASNFGLAAGKKQDRMKDD